LNTWIATSFCLRQGYGRTPRNDKTKYLQLYSQTI
jgi:hypothetical protein